MASAMVEQTGAFGLEGTTPKADVCNVTIQSPEEEFGFSDDDEETYHDATSHASSPVKLSSDEGVEGLKEKRPPKVFTPEQKLQVEERILALINFYFGDDNYSKDQFLRKQASLDTTGEGWILLDVLCSFKKMKKLTEDREMIITAAKNSSIVVLSQDETRIRRKEPLAKDVEDALARTIILGNVPSGSTEESIRAICSQFGAVMRVRFFACGRDDLPKDIVAFCVEEHGELKNEFRFHMNRIYAFVEFVLPKYANAAVKSLHSDHDWRRGFEAVMLYKKPKGVDSSPSPASSLSQSREASPYVSTSERGRSNSMNSRPKTSPLGEAAGGAEFRERASSTNSRPVTNMYKGKPPSWRSQPLPPPAQMSVPPMPQQQRSRSPSLSPQSARRVVPDSSSGRASSIRSGLSHGESPVAWTAHSDRSSPVRAQTVVRQPAGPDGSRGFASRVPKA